MHLHVYVYGVIKQCYSSIPVITIMTLSQFVYLGQAIYLVQTVGFVEHLWSTFF